MFNLGVEVNLAVTLVALGFVTSWNYRQKVYLHFVSGNLLSYLAHNFVLTFFKENDYMKLTVFS